MTAYFHRFEHCQGFTFLGSVRSMGCSFTFTRRIPAGDQPTPNNQDGLHPPTQLLHHTATNKNEDDDVHLRFSSQVKEKEISSYERRAKNECLYGGVHFACSDSMVSFLLVLLLLLLLSGCEKQFHFWLSSCGSEDESETFFPNVLEDLVSVFRAVRVGRAKLSESLAKPVWQAFCLSIQNI